MADMAVSTAPEQHTNGTSTAVNGKGKEPTSTPTITNGTATLPSSAFAHPHPLLDDPNITTIEHDSDLLAADDSAEDDILHGEGDLIAADSDEDPPPPLGIDGIRALYYRRGPYAKNGDDEAALPRVIRAEERVRMSMERRQRFAEMQAAQQKKGAGESPAGSQSARVSIDRPRRSIEQGARRSLDVGVGEGSSRMLENYRKRAGPTRAVQVEFVDDSGEEDGTSSSRVVSEDEDEDDSEFEDDDDEDEDASDSEGHVCEHHHHHAHAHQHGDDCDHSETEDPSDSEAELEDDGVSYGSSQEFQVEFGRRYYDITKYPLPNDEPEKERLDLVHWLWYFLLDGHLHLAPLDPKKLPRALDIGTGTGLWAMEFADRFPNTEIIGIDLSAIQERWVPPHLTYALGDITEPWDFHDDAFTYMHLRNLSIGLKDWPSLLRTCFENLEPSGFLEIQESEMGTIYSSPNPSNLASVSLPQGSKLQRYLTNFTRALQILGYRTDLLMRIPGMLASAGFVNVQMKRVKLPLGDYAPEPSSSSASQSNPSKSSQLAQISSKVVGTSMEAYGLGVLTRGLGWDEKEARQGIEEATEEANELVQRRGKKEVRCYALWWVCTAQKPGPGTVVEEGEGSKKEKKRRKGKERA